jgi:hypothetical protein
VVALCLWCQFECRQQPWVFALEQLVEDVKISLSRRLGDDTRLLQEVVVDVTTNGGSLGNETLINWLHDTYYDVHGYNYNII